MWTPRLRPRSLDDEFFRDGDALRAQWIKQPFATTGSHAAAGGAAVAPTVLAAPEEGTRTRFECAQTGCRYAALDAFGLEAHYASAHAHVCDTCRRILPTSRLLEMHVLETHDVLFKLMAEREKMYACFVDGCEKKFIDSSKRRLHLIDKHKFPRDFNFSLTQMPRHGRHGQIHQPQPPRPSSTHTAAPESATMAVDPGAPPPPPRDGVHTSPTRTTPRPSAPLVPTQVAFGRGGARTKMFSVQAGGRRPDRTHNDASSSRTAPMEAEP